MKKLPLLFLVLVAAVIFVSPDAATSGPQGVVPVKVVSPVIPENVEITRTYLAASSATEDDLLRLRENLISAGARRVNLFLPDIIVCELPPGLDLDTVEGYAGVSRMEESAVRPFRAPGASSRESWIRMCYERLEQERSRVRDRTTLPDVPAHESFSDVVVMPDPVTAREVSRALRASGAASAQTREIFQNSEFFAGDILVQLILPESNGEYEDETENWTDDELLKATSAAFAGMLDIQASFPALPMHFVFESYERAPTGYEPIKHQMGEDAQWLIDVLRRIDPSLPDGGTRPELTAHAFNDKSRIAKRTDFAFTGFIANSRNAPNHRFHNANYTAYAKLGGPYNVQPYPAGLDPYNITDWMVFSKIFQHETGHVFWTLDEYESAPGECNIHSGYLWYANNNKDSQLNPEPDACDVNGPFNCIMRYAAREPVGRPWCKWTQGQMGVIDNNGNSIPDLFESAPVIRFNAAKVETVFTPDVTVGVRAISTAVKNKNQFQEEELRADYAAPLKSGNYNLMGLGAHSLQPVDGLWDETEEELSIRLTGLPAGRVSVIFKTRNAVGVWSKEYEKTLYYIGVNYAQINAATLESSIWLRWNVLDEQFGASFDVYRLDPGEEGAGTIIAADIQPAGPSVNGFEPYELYDTSVQPGRKYRYYVVGSFTLDIGGEARYFESSSVTVESTAMLPVAGGLISQAAPNPFNSSTRFSIVVPPTYVDQGGSGGVPGYQQRVATPVEISVYDVAGRRVTVLYQQETLHEVVTENWDGTSEKGVPVPSGVYFVRAVAGEQTGVTKILLIR
jgi:hypothetical protein